MYRRRRSSRVNRLLPCWREEVRRFARFPAENARYPLLPLLCPISRETVLGARPNRLAMAERPVPCASPRLTSSLSADESRRYGVVVCIRIHPTHIRCVRCLIPSHQKAQHLSALSLSQPLSTCRPLSEITRHETGATVAALNALWPGT